MNDTELLKTPKYTDTLYGRRWKVSVLVPLSEDVSATNDDDNRFTAHILSDSSNEDKSLRVKFNIQKYGYTAVNLSTIEVYNLNLETQNLLIKNGMRVRVEAGYVNGNYGLIYDSPIFQPMWEREDNVTTKVTFRCVDCLDWITDNWVATQSEALQYQKNMVLGMAGKSITPINLKDSDISEGMPNNQLPRSKVFFGPPMDYIRQYAQQGGTLPSVNDKDIVISRLQDALPEGAENNAIVISPGKGGLIGTPQQTQDGVTFTCLLNPNIRVFKPPMLVKLDNTIIRQAALQWGQKGFSRLDEDWMYRVIGVTHVGDTRGNEWYSNVIGANQSMDGLLPSQFITQQDTTP
jgi:hypothetical protein